MLDFHDRFADGESEPETLPALAHLFEGIENPVESTLGIPAPVSLTLLIIVPD
jgi:hypothetical protein